LETPKGPESVGSQLGNYVLTRADARGIVPDLQEVLDALVATGIHLDTYGEIPVLPEEVCLHEVRPYFLTTVRLFDRLEAYIVSPGDDDYVLSLVEFEAMEKILECADSLPDGTGAAGIVVGASMGALVLLALFM